MDIVSAVILLFFKVLSLHLDEYNFKTIFESPNDDDIALQASYWLDISISNETWHVMLPYLFKVTEKGKVLMLP